MKHSLIFALTLALALGAAPALAQEFKVGDIVIRSRRPARPRRAPRSAAPT